MVNYQFFPRASLAVWLLLVVLGAIGGVLVYFESGHWQTAGIAVLVVTLLCLILVLASIWSVRLVVQFDDDGYRIISGSESRAGRWRSVTSVAATPDGRRMMIRRADGAADFIVAPRGSSARQLAELTADLVDRLAAEGR